MPAKKQKPMEFSNEDSIESFMHCELCLKARPPDQSPMEWQRIQVGWTVQGLQVWCVRHNCNIVHIDFEGQKHPAITTRHSTIGEPSHVPLSDN